MKSGAKYPFISDSIRTGQGHDGALGKSPVRAASKSFVVEVIAANGLIDIAPDHIFFNTKAGDPQKLMISQPERVFSIWVGATLSRTEFALRKLRIFFETASPGSAEVLESRGM